MKLLSIGEILWDFIGGKPHLGGAPFNFAVQAHKLGHNVAFVSAVGDDDLGRKALAEAAARGVSTEYIATVSDAATGTVTVELDRAGQPNFSIHRPAAYDYIPTRAFAFDPDWICYGTLLQMGPAMRRRVSELVDAYPRALRFYDLNLRLNHYTWDLVADLIRTATAIKLNDAEAQSVELVLGPQDWKLACITHGRKGCTVIMNGERVDCPGYKVKVRDTVGAGDAFAAAFLHGLDQGWPPNQIGDFANRVAADVVSRRGA
jgi:fructokinase